MCFQPRCDFIVTITRTLVCQLASMHTDVLTKTCTQTVLNFLLVLSLSTNCNLDFTALYSS